MRSNLVKLALGCGLAAAFVAPAFACEFYKQTVKTDQDVAQSQQATPEFQSGGDARYYAADGGIAARPERGLELTMRQGRGR